MHSRLDHTVGDLAFVEVSCGVEAHSGGPWTRSMRSLTQCSSDNGVIAAESFSGALRPYKVVVERLLPKDTLWDVAGRICLTLR